MDRGRADKFEIGGPFPRDPLESADRAREVCAPTSTLPRYADLLESLADATIVTDSGGRIVLFNSEAERVFGYKATEVVGRPLRILLPAERQATGRSIAPFAAGNLLGRKGRHRVELRGQHKDGSTFDTEAALSEIDLDGRRLLTAVVRDISAHKKLERALRESEQLLRRSQEVAGLGSWGWDRKTGKQVWSDEFYRLLGLRPGEVAPTYENYLPFIHPEDRAKYCGPDIDAWAHRLQAGKSYPDLHVRIVRPDGAVRWMYRWFGIEVDADGEIIGATGTLQDITEQRAAAERLRESERLLKRAQQLSRIGSWEFNLETQQSNWSDELFEILGLDPRKNVASNDLFRSMVHPDDQQLSVRRYEDAIDNRLATQSFDLRTIRADGAVRVLHLLYEFDWGQGPVPLKMTGAAQDITEQKAAEAALKTALDAADEANMAKSAFLANMSHELRTPLNAIIGFSELIESLGESMTIQKICEYAHYIHSSGTHLLEIICDILDLSRIEAGSLALTEETIEIADLIDWAMNMIRPQAEAAGVSLQADMAAQAPAIAGDRRLLRESLLNLLSNAVKFTPEGGSVAVSSSVCANSDLMIVVSDTGIGMRADDIPAALTPFTQLENGLARKYDGAGLGLPLTKKFLELHGGRLEIESALHRGTSVRLTIPAARRRGH